MQATCTSNKAYGKRTQQEKVYNLAASGFPLHHEEYGVPAVPFDYSERDIGFKQTVNQQPVFGRARNKHTNHLTEDQHLKQQCPNLWNAQTGLQ